MTHVTTTTKSDDRLITFVFTAWQNGANKRDFSLTMPYCSGSKTVVSRELNKAYHGGGWTIVSDIKLG